MSTVKPLLGLTTYCRSGKPQRDVCESVTGQLTQQPLNRSLFRDSCSALSHSRTCHVGALRCAASCNHRPALLASPQYRRQHIQTRQLPCGRHLDATRPASQCDPSHPPPPSPRGLPPTPDSILTEAVWSSTPEQTLDLCRRWKTARYACATSAPGRVVSATLPSGAPLPAQTPVVSHVKDSKEKEFSLRSKRRRGRLMRAAMRRSTMVTRAARRWILCKSTFMTRWPRSSAQSSGGLWPSFDHGQARKPRAC